MRDVENWLTSLGADYSNTMQEWSSTFSGEKFLFGMKADSLRIKRWFIKQGCPPSFIIGVAYMYGLPQAIELLRQPYVKDTDRDDLLNIAFKDSFAEVASRFLYNAYEPLIVYTGKGMTLASLLFVLTKITGYTWDTFHRGVISFNGDESYHWRVCQESGRTSFVPMKKPNAILMGNHFKVILPFYKLNQDP